MVGYDWAAHVAHRVSLPAASCQRGAVGSGGARVLMVHAGGVAREGWAYAHMHAGGDDCGDCTACWTQLPKSLRTGGCRVAGNGMTCLFATAVFGTWSRCDLSELSEARAIGMLGQAVIVTVVRPPWTWFDMPGAYPTAEIVPLTVQIHPGHAILEGRKPALLDSLVQVGVPQCHQHVCTQGEHTATCGVVCVA